MLLAVYGIYTKSWLSAYPAISMLASSNRFSSPVHVHGKCFRTPALLSLHSTQSVDADSLTREEREETRGTLIVAHVNGPAMSGGS